MPQPDAQWGDRATADREDPRSHDDLGADAHGMRRLSRHLLTAAGTKKRATKSARDLQATWPRRQVNNPYAQWAAVLFELAPQTQERQRADERLTPTGQLEKRTSVNAIAMSALPPKADIHRRERHVRFVPKADIPRCGKKVAIRSPRQRGRVASVAR
jgi:hypothetical protein